MPSRFKPVADSRANLFTVYILIPKKNCTKMPLLQTPPRPFRPYSKPLDPPLIQAYTASQNLSIKTYSFHTLYKNVLRCLKPYPFRVEKSTHLAYYRKSIQGCKTPPILRRKSLTVSRIIRNRFTALKPHSFRVENRTRSVYYTYMYST